MRVARVCLIRLLLLAACLAAYASPLCAQVAAGEITGIVKDQAGAAVPGATVTVTNVDTNQQRILASSGEGVYAEQISALFQLSRKKAGLPADRPELSASGFRLPPGPQLTLF